MISYQNMESKLTTASGISINSQYKKRAMIMHVLVHIIFFLSIAVPIFALLTLNIPLILAVVVICLVQLLVPRNQKIIDWVNRTCNMKYVYDSFKIINDWEGQPGQEKTHRKCIFPFHPHSVYAMGLLCSINTPEDPAFKEMAALGSNVPLNFPVMGALFKIWGVESVSAFHIKKLMKEQRNIGLLPGGYQEATITSENQLRCYITHRKGFIKYAIDYGYTICPTIVLGEHQAFWYFQPLESLRLFFNRVKIPTVFFWNKKTGTILPTNISITVIKGKPMSVPEGPATHEQVDRLHRDYMQQVERLYSKYKHLNGDKPLKYY